MSSTFRQKINAGLYPLITAASKLLGKNNRAIQGCAKPLVSFYSLRATLSNGEIFSFENLKGKKVMIVNTASDCGYTRQYEQLKAVQEKYGEALKVLAFPSNDFNNQERGDDASINSFCKMVYGINFPIMKKAVVIKNGEQQQVYRWLSDSKINGWNDQAPTWNFCKYVIDENGTLVGFYEAAVEPSTIKIKNQVL